VLLRIEATRTRPLRWRSISSRALITMPHGPRRWAAQSPKSSSEPGEACRPARRMIEDPDEWPWHDPGRLSPRPPRSRVRPRDPHRQLGAVARSLPGEHRGRTDPLLTADQVAALLITSEVSFLRKSGARVHQLNPTEIPIGNEIEIE
jgi:hypothetical protein